MSPTSCRCSTPRSDYTAGGGFLQAARSVLRRRGRRWRRARRRGRGRARRRRDQEGALVRFRIAVQARLFLFRRARGDRLDVLVIALVLSGEHGVLMAEVAGLLGELVAEVRLLCEGVAGPDGDNE